MNTDHLLVAALGFVMVLAFGWLLMTAAKKDADRLAARVPEVDEDE